MRKKIVVHFISAADLYVGGGLRRILSEDERFEVRQVCGYEVIAQNGSPPAVLVICGEDVQEILCKRNKIKVNVSVTAVLDSLDSASIAVLIEAGFDEVVEHTESIEILYANWFAQLRRLGYFEYPQPATAS